MKRLLMIAIGAIIMFKTIPVHAQTIDKNFRFIDSANMDLSVKPGDNFFQYANGTWLKNNPVPPSKTRWGSFNVLIENNSQRLKALCEDAAVNDTKNSVYQRVGDLYASAMDSAAIEKLGAEPIKPELARLAALTTKEQILNEIATQRTNGVGGILFGFGVEQDDKDVNTYIPGVSQGGYVISGIGLYTLAGGIFYDDALVSQLIGTCPQAAFAENLYVRSLATDGTRRLDEYDDPDTKAFAVSNT
ncbi:MAG: M13 family metallopeptidase N-terminal domain-containing protein [Parafilimonas sp.]